jgi:hypothetical protein
VLAPQGMRLARLDATATARVVARKALRYDAALALQVGVGWVRAGSALARFGKRLMMVQDDALWLAWWDEQGMLRAEPLPPDEHGERVFSDKRRKPDFEAATVVGERLVVFGSGSLPTRERVALVEVGGSAQVLAVPALYALFKGEPRFAGRQLNIEGALVEHDRVVLFSRGNASAFAGEQGFDASIELDVSELDRYLAAPARASPPTPRQLQQYRLGEIDSVRLTLTDAALREGRQFYVAAAEASPDAVADGQVLGTSFGVLEVQPRYAHIEAEDGSLLREKVEGLAPGDRADEWLAITDPDDAARPAELLTLRVSGF